MNFKYIKWQIDHIPYRIRAWKAYQKIKHQQKLELRRKD